MTKIFVNARFLTQPVSGVQRYGIECSIQIKKKHPNVVFLSPHNIINKGVANELGAEITGKNTGHLWEQTDLPHCLNEAGKPPLLNLANTAPLLYSNNFITIHDLAFHHHPEWNSKAFSAWYNFLMPRIAKKSRHLFTVSKTMRREIIDSYKIPEQKISVTYNGLPHSIPPASITTKEKIILSVGSFNTRKNHHILIKAFLASNLKDTYKLVIIGDKSKVFSETGIDDAVTDNANIELLSRLTDEELAAIYGRAELVVSLSAYEGFGIPVLEGLYYGCKVVCSDIAVYRELYDKYAYFCNPFNIHNVRDTLQLAVNNGEGRSGDVTALLERYNYPGSADTIIEKIVTGSADTAL